MVLWKALITYKLSDIALYANLELIFSFFDKGIYS